MCTFVRIWGLNSFPQIPELKLVATPHRPVYVFPNFPKITNIIIFKQQTMGNCLFYDPYAPEVIVVNNRGGGAYVGGGFPAQTVIVEQPGFYGGRGYYGGGFYGGPQETIIVEQPGLYGGGFGQQTVIVENNGFGGPIIW